MQTIRRFPAHRALQSLSFLLPPPRITWPLIGWWFKRGGLVAIPYDGGELITRADWMGAPQMSELFGGVDGCNPELEHLERAWPKILERPGVLVDVGAAIGAYVLWMGNRSDRPIIAFEPSPARHLLAKMLVHNGLRGVAIRTEACDDHAGSVAMQFGANSTAVPADAANSTTVPTVRLDEAIQETVAFLKVDVEGMEVGVLEGARKIIERDRPALWIEGHPQAIGQFGHSIDELLSMLTGWGYQVETFMPSRTDGHVEVVRCKWEAIRSSPPAQIHVLAI